VRSEDAVSVTRKPRGKPRRGVRAGCQAGAEEPKRPRIAVVMCDCGGELGRLLDLDGLARRLEADPGITAVVRGNRTCTSTEVKKAAAAVGRAGIERVVVAGCSERLFGRFFRTHFARNGIAGAFVEFADLRHQSASVSKSGRAAATDHAARLIAAAAARVALAGVAEKVEAEMLPLCVVIGGGVAGVTAAVALAARGVEVVLVERDVDVGGLVRRLNVVYPGHVPSSDFVAARRRELAVGGVRVITGAYPVAARGQVGGFEVDLSDGQTVKAGAIIVATGADLLAPAGLFGYGADPRVITQMDLEALLARGDDPGRNIVMIQCAGSRNPQRPYCSRVCCTASIVNTIFIKQHFPSAKITVLSRGFAEYAGDLDRAREMGVEIIRYSPERPPVVTAKTVDVYDEISEMEAHIPVDRVVLAVPMVPSAATRQIADMLRMPTDSFGFLIEPHLRVRPEEYVPRGIFTAGCAHWPSTITESVVQAYSAASRAFDLIHSGKIVREAVVSSIDPALCRGCGRCVEVCRHGAIEIAPAEDQLKVARVIPVQCTGCGVCVSVCPSGAATLPGWSVDRLAPVVDAMIGGRD
jgi:heterodisulfide reductase subunit A